MNRSGLQKGNEHLQIGYWKLLNVIVWEAYRTEQAALSPIIAEESITSYYSDEGQTVK